MITALPPLPQLACVSPQSPDAAKASLYLTVRGASEEVDGFLEEARTRYPAWQVDAAALSKRAKIVRLRVSGTAIFRDVGGLIYLAQRRQHASRLQQLTVTMTTNQPLCSE